MILIRVTYCTKPGERDSFIQGLLDEKIPACTRREEGNICYDFTLPIEEPDTVYLIEQWKDTACLEKHAAQPMFHRLSELREKLGVTRKTVKIYEVKELDN